MSILSDFEDSVARAVEGVFAGVFRSRVQPAELAKALGKEMDKRRVVGVGKVYAPNLFTVVISPADEERLGSFTETLGAELATYLVGYAREKGYSAQVRPIVRFRVHDSLKLGRFEVIAELVSASELAEAAEEAGFYVPPDESASVPAPKPPRTPAPRPVTGQQAGAMQARPGPGVTMPPSAAARSDLESLPDAVIPLAAISATEAAGREQHTLRALSTVTVTGVEHDIVLGGGRMVVGRATSTDIRVPDANVSREHAVFEDDDGQWFIRDLDSTNGTFVNGDPVQRVRLRDGDVITVGVTELVYHQPRG